MTLKNIVIKEIFIDNTIVKENDSLKDKYVRIDAKNSYVNKSNSNL